VEGIWDEDTRLLAELETREDMLIGELVKGTDVKLSIDDDGGVLLEGSTTVLLFVQREQGFVETVVSIIVSVVDCGTKLEVHEYDELAVTGATATEVVSSGHFVVVVYVII